MRYISLFSGVGGFDLGFDRAGFECVGQCEFDDKAASVLARHWPEVPRHGDVSTLKGDAFGPAEVVVWGSPCQDLSVAGLRKGLKGDRSNLFHQGIRFIEELRDATDGQYPRFSVWENVPGAFSSNGGRDFRAVLMAFLQTEVPMPRSGKWAYAGVVRSEGREVAWRVLDSQHFGLAQRRKRVFVVADLGGHRAAEILFEREGVQRDTGASRAAGAQAAGGTGAGAQGGRGLLAETGIVQALTKGLGSGGPDAQHAQAGWSVPDAAPSGTARYAKGPDSDATDTMVVSAFAAANYTTGEYKEAPGVSEALTASTDRSRGAPLAVHRALAFKPSHYTRDKDGAPSEIMPPLSADADKGDQDPVVFGVVSKGNGEAFLTPERHMSLTSGGGQAGQGYPAAAVPIQDGVRADKRQNGLGVGGEGDPAYTLDSLGHQAVGIQNLTPGETQRRRIYGPEGVAPNLSSEEGRGQGVPSVATSYAVRRLMPVETERLQGFPDDWTATGIVVAKRTLNERGRALEAQLQREWEESDDPTADEFPPLPDDCYDTVAGVVEMADTHRYRFMGNAVSVPVAHWIAQGIKEALS